jgi:hypothetical protein
VDRRFDSFAAGLTIVEDPEQLFGAFEVTFAAPSVDTRVERETKICEARGSLMLTPSRRWFSAGVRRGM